MMLNYKAESKVAQASFVIKHKVYFTLCLILAVFDQMTKIVISSDFSLGESVSITSFFSLTYLKNSGAAFSFLADSGDLQRYFLLSISIVASLALIFWIQKTDVCYRQRLLGQSVLLAGAIGNLIDRALFGSVIDFIDLHYEGFYWPVFNLADSFIFIGVALLLFEGRQSKNSGEL